MFTCPRGGVIYTPGETGEVAFLLKRGLVQLYQLSPEGKRLVVGMLPPGAFFGDMPLLGQTMADTYAEAARECLICAMGQGDLEALLLAEPRVALRTRAATRSLGSATRIWRTWPGSRARR